MARSVSAGTSLNAKPRIATYLRALRWRSWIGWLFIFGLGSTLFALPPYNVLPISISFSLITGAIFVLNQYFDRKSDKSNPQKRPFARGFGRIISKTVLDSFHFFVRQVCLLRQWLIIRSCTCSFLTLLWGFSILRRLSSSRNDP